MPLLKNKADRKALYDKWDALMKDRREDDGIYVESIWDVLRLQWWFFFKKYRAVYFMQLCVNGMESRKAFEWAKSLYQSEVFKSLLMQGWE